MLGNHISSHIFSLAGLYHFFDNTSLRILLSSANSAYICFSLRFSSSSSLSLRSSWLSMPEYFFCRVSKGIAAQASHRTGRECLHSSGSSYSVTSRINNSCGRFVSPLPMREKIRITFRYYTKPVDRLSFMSL